MLKDNGIVLSLSTVHKNVQLLEARGLLSSEKYEGKRQVRIKDATVSDWLGRIQSTESRTRSPGPDVSQLQKAPSSKMFDELSTADILRFEQEKTFFLNKLLGDSSDAIVMLKRRPVPFSFFHVPLLRLLVRVFSGDLIRSLFVLNAVERGIKGRVSYTSLLSMLKKEARRYDQADKKRSYADYLEWALRSESQRPGRLLWVHPNSILLTLQNKVVELADTRTMLEEPLHPYTQLLVEGYPLGPPLKTHNFVEEVGLAAQCPYANSCPYAHERCVNEEPKLIEVESDHFVACHLYT